MLFAFLGFLDHMQTLIVYPRRPKAENSFWMRETNPG